MKGSWFIPLFKELREVLIPSRCVLCGIYGFTVLCPSCLKEIETLAKPMRDEKLQSFSLFFYEGKIRELVHLMKYKGFYDLGVILGMIMGRYFNTLTNSFFDGIIPVPLHRRELRNRGYNQSEALVKGFICEYPMPNLKRCLVKVKETRPQVGLSSAQRRENVKGVFSSCKDIKGKRIILIDDVFTTGETIKSCQKVLKLNGAITVETFTLCKQL